MRRWKVLLQQILRDLGTHEEVFIIVEKDNPIDAIKCNLQDIEVRSNHPQRARDFHGPQPLAFKVPRLT